MQREVTIFMDFCSSDLRSNVGINLDESILEGKVI